MTHVQIDEQLCIGSGNCTHFAPAVFSLNDDGIAVIVADVSPDSEEAVRMAASQCPTGAISVEPADAGAHP